MTEKLDFRISSGLKDIIGKELITDDRIAIFELVKNSYDANANETKRTQKTFDLTAFSKKFESLKYAIVMSIVTY